MKIDPKQIHNMAPFGLIFIQDGSHKLWEASGMPPGFKTAQKIQKYWFSGFSNIFVNFPIITVQQQACLYPPPIPHGGRGVLGVPWC